MLYISVSELEINPTTHLILRNVSKILKVAPTKPKVQLSLAHIALRSKQSS